MAAKKTQLPKEETTILPSPPESLTSDQSWRLVAIIGALLIVGAFLMVGFELTYSGKIYPGVSADGVYLGGLTKTQAVSDIVARTKQYEQATITASYNRTTLPIPLSSIGLTYNAQAGATDAYDYGRSGNVLTVFKNRLRSLFDRDTTFATYSYNDNALANYVGQVFDAVDTPVVNASLSFDNGQIGVNPATTGNRLDIGLFVTYIEKDLASTNTATVAAPIGIVAPVVTSADLDQIRSQAQQYVAGPITVKLGSTTDTVGLSQIVQWLQVNRLTNSGTINPTVQNVILSAPTPIEVSINTAQIQSYVASLAVQVNVPAQNAVLTWANNAVSVVTPSVNGVSLDQTDAVKELADVLTKPADDRTVTFTTQSSPAAVNENNLASLGITQQLSSATTYFPGSPSNRLQNVSVGAARFNNVLLAPGQEFSFGAILGAVGAAQGYTPGLVILGNEETEQYGGGLCQVSSTAFRAALLAGLPINEREGHAFAISYYTWPYGVPGVDATIYYPQVDLKFTNDTGHYILMTTSMDSSASTLNFSYYGTKTKVGVIRGPYFVSGSNDAALASHTVFYRDVEDLNGNVIKTDTFNTYYQPSTDFPVEATAN